MRVMAIAGAAGGPWEVRRRRGWRYYILQFVEMLILMIVTGPFFIAPLPGPADWVMAPGAQGPLMMLQAQGVAELLAHCDLPLPSAARSSDATIGPTRMRAVPPRAV